MHLSLNIAETLLLYPSAMLTKTLISILICVMQFSLAIVKLLISMLIFIALKLLEIRAKLTEEVTKINRTTNITSYSTNFRVLGIRVISLESLSRVNELTKFDRLELVDY